MIFKVNHRTHKMVSSASSRQNLHQSLGHRLVFYLPQKAWVFIHISPEINPFSNFRNIFWIKCVIGIFVTAGIDIIISKWPYDNSYFFWVNWYTGVSYRCADRGGIARKKPRAGWSEEIGQSPQVFRKIIGVAADLFWNLDCLCIETLGSG